MNIGQYAKTIVAALTVVAEVLLQASEITQNAHELVIALIGVVLVYVVPNSSNTNPVE